jgi:hypothetical protein
VAGMQRGQEGAEKLPRSWEKLPVSGEGFDPWPTE